MVMAAPPFTTHATCVAIKARGIVILGPSGSGKSDLALRLIDRGAILVSDDYCELVIDHGSISVSPPATIAGQIEVRGLGIFRMPHLPSVNAILAVRIADSYPRMPDNNYREMLGNAMIPALVIAPFEASAPIKIEMALQRILDQRA